ncbi:hypothetical protein BDZ89DRAFT_1142137 [Hymenopellis radicata]|nr:hypothetical protein BDZ89DRAFT_1142137 [Hymenopellis radicata]
MNFVGGTNAISLYPKASFVRHVNIGSYRTTAREVDARDKYVDRGWPLADARAPQLASSIYPDMLRVLSSKTCWIHGHSGPHAEPGPFAGHSCRVKYQGMSRCWCVGPGIAAWIRYAPTWWNDHKFRKTMKVLDKMGVSAADVRRLAIDIRTHHHTENCYNYVMRPSRTALRLTGAYVSGSVALAYFTRNISRDQVHDLDVYVTPWGITVFNVFLLSQGYHFQPLPWQTPDTIDDELVDNDGNPVRPYLGPAILEVFNYVHETDNESVQVIVVNSCPAAALITHHSTVVINYIDARFAVSCYPAFTFKMRINVPVNGQSINDVAGREKYAARGWPVISDPDDLSNLESLKLSRIRVVGDKACWVQQLVNDDAEENQRPLAQSWSAFLHESDSHVRLHCSIFRRDRMARYFCMDVALSRWAFCPMHDWTDSDLEHAMRVLTDVDQPDLTKRRMARVVMGHIHCNTCFHWRGRRRACTHLRKILL